MLSKKEILDELREFTNRHWFYRENIQVIGDAALVLHGLKSHATKIDLDFSFETCEQLLEKGGFRQEDTGIEAKIRITNEIFNIQNQNYSCEESKERYMVQTLPSLLRMKSQLNREKDKPDIERLQTALGQY